MIKIIVNEMNALPFSCSFLHADVIDQIEVFGFKTCSEISLFKFFFLTVGQNNFRNKIPMEIICHKTN